MLEGIASVSGANIDFVIHVIHQDILDPLKSIISKTTNHYPTIQIIEIKVQYVF